MKPRILLLLAALLTSGEAFSEPLLPEQLAYQEGFTAKLIPYQDGVLVECDSLHAANHYMFARFEAKELSPVKITGIESLVDVARGADGLVFLGLVEPKPGELKAVLTGESADAKARPLPVPRKFNAGLAADVPTLPRLIETNQEAAAIAGDTVWWLDKTWKSRKLPEVPKFHAEFLSDESLDAHCWFLDGTVLYGGWDHGEWGGALASIDLGAAASKWVYLGDKPAKDDSGIPGHNPIQSILSPRSGELWVAAGLSHMGGTWRGLYHREPTGKWRALIHGEFDEDHGELKQSIPSAIDGLAFDHQGTLHVLANEAGIYRMGKSGLELLIKHRFGSHVSDRAGSAIGCHPIEIAVSRNGDIFVSTNSFGVLAFRKTGDQWSGRQITWGKPKEKNSEADKPSPPREASGEK